DNGSGLDHFDLSVDNKSAIQLPASPMSYSVSSLADGRHRIEVTAYDAFGNPNSAAVDVTVDTSPPSLQITAPQDGHSVRSGTVEVTWLAADAGTGISGFKIQVDGGSEVQ